MTVSTYGDPSQLIVLPLGANLAMLVAGFTVFIVQVSDFQIYLQLGCLWVMSVILRISTVEVV
jgi:hypothetical protein